MRVGRWELGAARVAAIAIMAAGIAGPAGAQSAPVVRVPRGGPVVIDARISPAEWSGAAVLSFSDGSELRLEHDDRYLYLAIRAHREGFPSVCVAGDGGEVRIFHAAAALAQADYARGGKGWQLRSPFDFGLRTRDTTEAARAERAQYLQQHGWLASTMYMGDRLQKEMQIPLSALGRDGRLAVAYVVSAPGVPVPAAVWPTGLRNGCINERLSRGFSVPNLDFDPDDWARVELAP